MSTPLSQLPSISPEAPGAPPTGSKSHTLAWILGGCGTVLVLAIIAGILGVRMFMKNHVHKDANGEVSIDMPGGTSMKTGKAKDIGIPVYPSTVSGGTGMEVTSPRKDQNMSMAMYNTGDAIEKVDAWYQENLSNDYVREGPGVKHTIPGGRRFPVPIRENSITFVSNSLKSDSGVSVVTLTQMGTMTQIVLMTAGATSAQ